MSDVKLKAWEAAGLIDAATADRIRVWEASNSRPMALWALFGIAALAIGLGLISLIAANWDAIPGEARLAIHFVLMLALAAYLRWKPASHEAFHEALCFILAALGLTFFGHIGQVYQTSSPLWQPLALWLFLFSPLLLGFGRGWLTALAWFIGFAGTTISWLSYLLDTQGQMMQPFVIGLLAAVPVLVVGLAAWMRSRSARPDFWRRLEQAALVFAVWGTSQALVMSAFVENGWGNEGGMSVITFNGMALIGLVTAALVWKARPGKSGTATAAILTTASALLLLSQAILGWDVGAALLFMAFWAAIGAASLYAGWRGVFQVATAVIALRLIILSFELASDLLGSGVGLILAGLLTLVIAWGAVRISKHYAPQEDAA